MPNLLEPAAADGLLMRGLPRLGMGCGDLYGGSQASQSARLVEAAFDAGIRYFDVARLYGDGSAEGVVGHVLKPVRDKVILTTKVGILPWSMQLGARVAHKAKKAARACGPLARRFIPAPPPAKERYGAFGLREMQRSLETSLRALGTDYLDILLLHECTPADISYETLGFLERFRKAGKLRAYGIATHHAATLKILGGSPIDPAVVQIGSDAFNRNIRRLAAGTRLIVTHSALKHALPRLKTYLSESPLVAARWETALGISHGDSSGLARILIGLALEDNPNGIVLFSTSRPERFEKMMEMPLPAASLRAAREEIVRLSLAPEPAAA